MSVRTGVLAGLVRSYILLLRAQLAGVEQFALGGVGHVWRDGRTKRSLSM